MTIGALLLALSLIIPLALGGVLGVVIGPFSATLASHVPIMISMLFGPGVAGTVALGSAIGFFVKLGPVVGMRAAMHIPVAILGAILLKRQLSYPLVLAITGPIHALLEGLIVQPFLMFGSSMLYGESQPLALFYLCSRRHAASPRHGRGYCGILLAAHEGVSERGKCQETHSA